MTAAIHPDTIPADLKSTQQWVAWRYEERGGKTTKAPIDAKSNGKLTYAKSNDPATWASLDDAIDACGRHPELAGVGFCFAPDDGLTGIDLDHVIDPETRKLKPEAVEIVTQFAGTYCEVSPSGTGLRLFAFGKPARSGKNTGTVKWCEVYSHPSNRYLTVTGNHWPGSATEVTEQQDALDWLHQRFMQSTGEAVESSPSRASGVLNLDDAAILDKAHKAKNGGEFARLWTGDTSGHGGDDSAADLALCNLLAFWTGGNTDRVDRLFRQSGLMRKKWDTKRGESTYGAATVDKAIAGCSEFYGDRVQSEPSTWYQAEAVSGLEEFKDIPRLPTVSPCTHLANSHRIRHYYRGHIWYALGMGWVMWTGKFWRSDPTSEGAIATGFIDGLSRMIAREAGALSRRASDEADEDRRKSLMTQAEALLKWAVQSENERTIAAGLKLTKHALLIEYHTLNADPWLFNVQNGTIDLRIGKLRPHNPNDLITFLSPVTYDPTADCPTWKRFLLEVFASDAEMVAFIQRGIGWSLTGVVKERALFFLHGNAGKNGKTTLVEAVMKLVGTCGESSYGYGRKVGADTFMKSRNSEDNQRKAATLAGPRFICTSEVDEDHRLDEQLVKDITGGDTLEGRRLYQESFTFKPQFKPWMYGNHKPEIRGTDDAIWSRVRLVPFDVSFKGREDLELPNKLEAELSGILNWAIQGCLDWQRSGLQPPAKVQAATQAYRDEMDVFGPFIAERCVIHRGADVRANDLWNAYKTWCEESGTKEQTQTKFGKYLTSKGFYVEKSSVIKRIGIGLLDTNHSDSGRVGIVGTDRQKSPIEKPPKGTFPHNPPNCPNPPEQPPSPPVGTKLEADGDAVLSQHADKGCIDDD